MRTSVNNTKKIGYHYDNSNNRHTLYYHRFIRHRQNFSRQSIITKHRKPCRQYHFTTIERFQQGIKDEQFLEYAQVFDNYYGTAKSSVQDLLHEGKDVILEIDWQGALQVKEMYQQGKLTDFIDELSMIFLLPPNKETLRERLSSRGQDSDEVIEKRLAGAVTEMSNYREFDYVVINDNFEQALAELTAIIISHRQKMAKQSKRHADMIAELLK